MGDFCTKCGTKNTENNFCVKCGTKIDYNQHPTNKQKISQDTPHMRSPFWYLLPISFGIIGGIIAWSLLKNTDNQKAKRALVIGIVLSIPLVGWMALQMFFGVPNPFYVVASGSMSPALELYDIIVTQGNIPFEDIETGDIIVYDRPSDHNIVIVQRVVSILDDDPKTLRTKGDVNPASIPGTNFPITEEEYIGKVVYILPQVGYVTQLLKPPVNYFLILVFFVIVFAILGIKHKEYEKTR